jgi:hypothetical protein
MTFHRGRAISDKSQAMVIRYLSIFFAACLLFLFSKCAKEDDIDTEYPVIDLSSPGSYPQNCDTVYRGNTFTAKAFFTDNEELGAYSIDIHENFDHHTHSADIEACVLDPIKDPVDPFQFIESFDIPAGLQEYSMEQDIYVPQDADTGDYHFMIRLTDRAGWQSLYGLSIKVL